MSDGRPGSPLRHLSTIGNPEPGDEQVGGWPRERLVSMDEKFRHALARAVASGKERACDTVSASCSLSTTLRSPVSRSAPRASEQANAAVGCRTSPAGSIRRRGRSPGRGDIARASAIGRDLPTTDRRTESRPCSCSRRARETRSGSASSRALPAPPARGRLSRQDRWSARRQGCQPALTGLEGIECNSIN
jgi:hypothetical protein